MLTNKNSSQKAAGLRKQVKFVITVMSILIVDLIISGMNSYISSLGDTIVSRYWITAGAMLLVVLLFYFLFEHMNRMTEWVMKHFMDISRAFLGKRSGLYLVFLLGIITLYVIYHYMWFKENIASEWWRFITALVQTR